MCERVDLLRRSMMLFSCSHTLFLFSFVQLRRQQPGVDRPFKLPGGIGAACAYTLPPLAICFATLVSNLRSPAHAASFAGTLALGGLAHAAGLLRRRCKGSAAGLAAAAEVPPRRGYEQCA